MRYRRLPFEVQVRRGIRRRGKGAARRAWTGLVVLAACAGPAAPGRGPGEAHPAALREDAVPRYLEEGEVDAPARPLQPIRPAYPEPLRVLGVEGEVEARVAVRADGSVGGARLVRSSDEAFTAALREALRQARFHPARRDGVPVASWVTVRLRFRLEE